MNDDNSSVPFGVFVALMLGLMVVQVIFGLAIAAQLARHGDRIDRRSDEILEVIERRERGVVKELESERRELEREIRTELRSLHALEEAMQRDAAAERDRALGRPEDGGLQ